MKQPFSIALARAFVLVCLTAGLLAVSCRRQDRPATVDILTRFYGFLDHPVPLSVLSEDYPEGRLELGPEGASIRSFSVRLDLDTKIPSEPATVLDIPGILRVVLRQHDPTVWNPQNYPACPMPDGTVSVLEASLTLHSEVTPGEVRDMVVGIPLALLDKPESEHEVVIDFTGVRWSMYVDGYLCDNDFALGYPISGGTDDWKIDPARVEKASFWSPGIEAARLAVPFETAAYTGEDRFGKTTSSGIQYWIPPYYNAWVGDVAATWFDGRYHLFYLFDRRGHGSKFGRGGHYFEHLSTADFKTWQEHLEATPIEEQWETFGTGTPFAKDGKLCLSYGLHTTRIYPEESTNLPEQKEYLNEHGGTGCFPYDSLEGKVPAGTTWAFSEDGGETFVKSRMTVHPCENPSIFTDDEGGLRMLANYRSKGTWVSDRLEGGWKCIDPDFPLGGDCTFPFSWGDWDYVVGGFNCMWKRQKGREDLPWQDMVAASEDFYNGISVPSVTKVGDRLVMAGWLKMRSWAGALIIYELLPRPDGSIGSKWMEEIVPARGDDIFKEKKISTEKEYDAGASSFILEFEVVPTDARDARCSVGFLPEDGGDPCYLGIDLPSCRAQYSSDPASKEKTLAEGCRIHSSADYAVAGGMRLDSPFKVRIAVKGDPRFNGCIIDTEIAGEKTLVTYRRGLDVGKLLFSPEGCTIRKVKCSKIKE